jgi:hypothetical protein
MVPGETNPTLTASPEPSFPAGLQNLPRLTVPASAIKTANGVSLPTFQAYDLYYAGTLVSSQIRGSRYFLVDWTAVDAKFNPTSTATAIMRFGDASTGSVGSVPLPLTQAELNGLRANVGGGISATTDGSNLAVVVWYRLGAPGGQGVCVCICNAGAPMAWRILVAPIDASTGAPGSFTTIATGRNLATFMVQPIAGCADESPPLVALDGGRIAYNVENATAGHPLASTIVVRSLAGGAPERQIATQARPIRLELAGTNVAWLEAEDSQEGGLRALPLRISTAAQPAPTDVDAMNPPDPNAPSVPALPRFSLVGDQIAWDRYGTGEVFVETIGTGAVRQISPSGTSCLLGGSDAGQVLAPLRERSLVHLHGRGSCDLVPVRGLTAGAGLRGGRWRVLVAE